jgi:hypothetical protein
MLLSTPPKFGNDCKQAGLFYKTNKYFHTKKNDTGCHITCVLTRSAMCIGIYHIDLARAIQASNQACFIKLPHSLRGYNSLDCFNKTSQYFHIKKKTIQVFIMHFLQFPSFAQSQRICLLLFCQQSGSNFAKMLSYYF